MSYAPAVGYAPDDGYPRELGFAEDPGYGGDLGYPEAGHEATSVPPMEQLADPDEFFDTPVLASRSASVPALALASDPVLAPGAGSGPDGPEPAAALPQESTQSWDAAPVLG